MASPQLEDGYTRIANELLDAMIKSDLSKREMKVALCVARMTYGFARKVWVTDYQEIAERTGLLRRHVISTVKSLQTRSVVSKKVASNTIRLSIMKDYDSWTGVTKTVTPSRGDQNSHSKGDQNSHSKGDQNSHSYKEKESFKETIKKVALSIFTDIRERQPNFKQPNFKVWEKDIRLTVERDNRTVAEVLSVWQWAHESDFWQANILSPAKLRKQFDTLQAQMARDKKQTMRLPADDKLESFAKSHGLSKPGKTQSYFDYRKTLEREVAHGGRL